MLSDLTQQELKESSSTKTCIDWTSQFNQFFYLSVKP